MFPSKSSVITALEYALEMAHAGQVKMFRMRIIDDQSAYKVLQPTDSGPYITRSPAVGRPNKYTQAKIEAIVADYGTGMPLKVISAKHNVPHPTIIKFARTAGCPRRHVGGLRGRKKFTKEQREAAVADYAAGMVLKELTAKHGVSIPTVLSWARDANLSRGKPEYTNRQQSDAVADYSAGIPLKIISYRYGICAETVRKWARQRGIMSKPRFGGSALLTVAQAAE